MFKSEISNPKVPTTLKIFTLSVFKHSSSRLIVCFATKFWKTKWCKNKHHYLILHLQMFLHSQYHMTYTNVHACFGHSTRNNLSLGKLIFAGCMKDVSIDLNSQSKHYKWNNGYTLRKKWHTSRHWDGTL